MSDGDATPARTTRQAVLDSAVRSDALVLGTHFPTLPAGRVAADGDVWRFVPDAGRP